MAGRCNNVNGKTLRLREEWLGALLIERMGSTLEREDGPMTNECTKYSLIFEMRAKKSSALSFPPYIGNAMLDTFGLIVK